MTKVWYTITNPIHRVWPSEKSRAFGLKIFRNVHYMLVPIVCNAYISSCHTWPFDKSNACDLTMCTVMRITSLWSCINVTFLRCHVPYDHRKKLHFQRNIVGNPKLTAACMMQWIRSIHAQMNWANLKSSSPVKLRLRTTTSLWVTFRASTSWMKAGGSPLRKTILSWSASPAALKASMFTSMANMFALSCTIRCKQDATRRSLDPVPPYHLLGEVNCIDKKLLTSQVLDETKFCS